MCKNGSCGERFLERVERSAAGGVEIPRCIFASESGEGYCDVRVVLDEATIEVGKAEEGLDVLDFSGFWPIKYSLDLVFGHREAGGRHDVTKVLDGVFVPFAFIGSGVQTMFSEAFQDLPDVFFVICKVFRVDQYVV